jgi:hypothetical protein
MVEQNVGAGPSDGFYGRNVQSGARDEYSGKVCGVPVARQWRGDEVRDRGSSVGTVFADTVSCGYPDDVSGRLNICIREKAESRCGQANREHL